MPELTGLLKSALDWHLRVVLRRSGLPDLPEVRRLTRASWLNGFTFGAYPGRQGVRAIRDEARDAIGRSLAAKEDDHA